MSRNFGIGSRDMAVAARLRLQRSAQRKECGFSTAATQAQRFSEFVEWAKAQGVKRLEDITRALVVDYGKTLAERVHRGMLAPATAQNLVSAINTVLALATQDEWRPVSPTIDCGIAKRTFIRDHLPGGLDDDALARAKARIAQRLGAKLLSLVALCRDFGLRSEEAAKINAHQALKEARASGAVTIRYGTKGGRVRIVPITLPSRQMRTLEQASKAQQNEKSLIPQDMTWKAYRAGPLRDARELLKQETGRGLHDLRASYACERYQTLTGHVPPCSGTPVVDKEQDQAARL